MNELWDVEMFVLIFGGIYFITLIPRVIIRLIQVLLDVSRNS